MKTILITGSEGFTGTYLCQRFKHAGYKIVGLVHKNPKNSQIECDLTDRLEVEKVIKEVKPDGLIHLAALSFVGHEDQSAFYKNNIFSTLNLLEAMDKAGLNPEKIVIASSANVYGNPEVALIDELTPPNPVNHYAASKLAMEYMVKNWFLRFPIIITRPFNYTGPGQDLRFLIPKIVDHYRSNKRNVELGNLDVSRDFSDVHDIAQGYLSLFESNAKSEIVNLCSGKVFQLRDIIDMMNQIANYQIEVTVNPQFVRKDEIKELCGDNRKLKALTGFNPLIDLKETLADMYRFLGIPS